MPEARRITAAGGGDANARSQGHDPRTEVRLVSRTPEKIPMTEKRYSLRLIERFGFYDTVKTQAWHEWQAGATVTDPREIEILEARNAPVERIAT
jgi:hypothetical protein